MDLKGKKVTLHDMCLRDGMHAKQHQISPEQMATMVSHLHDNNRPVKPLGERELTLVMKDETTTRIR